MADETKERTPGTAEELVKQLAQVQRRFGYKSLLERWSPITQLWTLNSQPIYRFNVEDAPEGYLTFTIHYSKQPPAADSLALAGDPESTEENQAEPQAETLSAAEEGAVSALIHAALAEADAIIDRLEQDREEIDSLKKETRSNISELQRMIAA